MLSELIGFLLMVLNGWTAVIYWRIQGVSFELAFLMLTVYWSFTLLLTYFGTGCIIDILEKWFLTEELSIKIVKFRKITPFYNQRDRIVDWLTRQKISIIFILAFIPCIPEIPTLVIIATRIIKIKYGLLILLAGNIFRVFVLCYAVYFTL
jgi:hypothetical protein